MQTEDKPLLKMQRNVNGNTEPLQKLYRKMTIENAYYIDLLMVPNFHMLKDIKLKMDYLIIP